ncbi:hypothetical protein GWD52_09105 [Enterobacteriaceae bacterium 4M9]|nr:hypothetical protein [Enterobacteriaceae bacterium 4M9]
MKSVYEPDNEDILEWVNSGQASWPASDWDYYVANGKNDELIFKLANDHLCEKRDFFIHALYYLVGNYYNNGSVNKNEGIRIMKLLNQKDEGCSLEVILWKKDVDDLLSGKLTFDKEYWLHHMF